MAGNMELPRTIEECDQILKFIEENVEDVKAAFAIFDKNGDGTIATKALLAVMRSLGLNPTEDEVDNMINEVDIDGNGVVDFIEFMLMMNKMWSNVDEAIREAFKIFDSDGSGAIDLEEFRTVMTSQGAADITETEVQEIIQQADVDGDGQIDLEEFVQMLNN